VWNFLAYESDKERAIELVRKRVAVNEGSWPKPFLIWMSCRVAPNTARHFLLRSSTFSGSIRRPDGAFSFGRRDHDGLHHTVAPTIFFIGNQEER
jgi:hypothetical protein